jgi:hypothetical protein
VILGALGCAAVIGLKDRSPSFCGDPAKQHFFCEDFDHPGAIDDFTTPKASGGGTIDIDASDEALSPPNMAILYTPPDNGTNDGQVLAGMTKEFDHPLTHVRIQVDLRFEQLELPMLDGGFFGAAGLVLVQDKEGFSFGIGAGPGGTIGAILGVGATPDANVQGGTPLYTGLPMLQWLHLLVEIERDSQGGASLVVTIEGQPGTAASPPRIAPGSIAGTGTTLIGIASQAIPPTGNIQIDYDNLVVDFLD